MGDLLAVALKELRFWKSSAASAASILFLALAWLLSASPDLSGGIFSSPQADVLWGHLPPWILGLGAVLGAWAAGEAWSSMAYYAFSWVQMLLLCGINPEENPRGYVWHQRLRSVVPARVIVALQASFADAEKYKDLPLRDRPGAFKLLFKDALLDPLTNLDLGRVTGVEAIRSLANVRACCGVLPWLPAGLYLLGGSLDQTLALVSTCLVVSCAASSIILPIWAWRNSRRALSLVVQNAIENEVLGHYCTLALNSSRSPREVREAENRLVS